MDTSELLLRTHLRGNQTLPHPKYQNNRIKKLIYDKNKKRWKTYNLGNKVQNISSKHNLRLLSFTGKNLKIAILFYLFVKVTTHKNLSTFVEILDTYII